MSNSKTPSNKKDTTNFTYKQVFSGEILSDGEYQRPIDYKRVRKIVENFNPMLVNPIKISFRDGKYYVFDGQHTLKALIMRNGGKDLNVECKVYVGLTKQEESRLFSEQNGIFKMVDINAKLKALYVAGDIDVVELKNTMDELGIIFDFTKSVADKKIICVSTVFNIFKRASGDVLREVLQIILDAWNGESNSLRKEIINGVYLFHITYQGKYDRKRLVDKLKGISTIKIVRDASVTNTGGNKRYARQVLMAYNNNAQSKRLKDLF